jgi:hypothetical protein
MQTPPSSSEKSTSASPVLFVLSAIGSFRNQSRTGHRIAVTVGAVIVGGVAHGVQPDALRIVAPRADERERFAAAIADVREELADAVATMQPTPVRVRRVAAQTSSPGRLCPVVS